MEIHVDLAGRGARATDVLFGAWMEFAPGRGRAAPSDDLPGQVSCWLQEGPFTLGAVWPPRFLPPLPFTAVECVPGQQSWLLHPGPGSSLSLGLALREAVSGQSVFSPLPRSILPISNATAQWRAPWEGTRSLQDLSPSFSTSHFCLVLRCILRSFFLA